jgi:hypothetical protein
VILPVWAGGAVVPVTPPGLPDVFFPVVTELPVWKARNVAATPPPRQSSTTTPTMSAMSGPRERRGGGAGW